MIFSRIILFLLFTCVAMNLPAQVTGVRTEIDKHKILIGEPIRFTIELRWSQNTTPLSFDPDSIPHFEMLEEPVVDSSRSNGMVYLKKIYTLTSFDSGHWVIPAYRFGPRLSSDSFPVDVVFSDFDPNQDYHDIKDIIEVNPKKKTPWWWYAAGGALLVLLALIYFLRKKKPALVKSTIPMVSLDAYEEAMKELDELQRAKPDPKTFYTKLTGIFRLYVYRKKGILSLQKTTDDLVLQLKGLDLFSKEQFDKLAQSLRLSDFVKFAKYIPSIDDDATAFDTIRDSIINIEKSETRSPSSGGS
jgi:LPXTG-motif cell wall-anchored protein